MAADYKVVNVQAFTSPEGLRDPSPQWKEGNKGLSGRRAVKAKELAEAACKNGSCITGGITPPKDVELLPLDFENHDETTSEGKGKALEDEVVDAWDRGDSEDIKEQKTEAAEKRVKAAGGRHAKAEVIYQYLRRSRIDLVKTVHREWVENVTTPASVDRQAGNCPPEILEAARNAWRAWRPGRRGAGEPPAASPTIVGRMLSITTKSPYAIRALAELARPAATARSRSASSPAAATSRSSSSSSSSRSCAAPASCAPSAASRAATLRPRPARDHRPRGRRAARRPLGADAEGIFAEAAEAARAVLADHDRRRRRPREPGGGRDDVLHLSRGMDRFTGGCLCGNVRIVGRGPHTGSASGLPRLPQAPRGPVQRVRGVSSGCGDDRGRRRDYLGRFFLSPAAAPPSSRAPQTRSKCTWERWMPLTS